MAIGVVESNEFDLEIDRLSGAKPEGNVIDINRGRGLGNNEVPDCLRKVIGDNAITEGSAETKELTRALGISDSSLSAYKQGATSTSYYHNQNSELKDHNTKTRTVIVKKARNRLLRALNHITDEKLEAAKLSDITGVATAMSAVIKNIEPDVPPPNTGGPTFVIYAPQVRQEKQYETISVNE